MPPLEKALITNTITEEEIPVLFNPAEYTLNRDNNFAQVAVPGLSSPLIQFVNGNLKTLEMELFFDSYEKRQDVREFTNRVIRLMDIDPDRHAPPVLEFTWASLSFTCVLARASQKFTMFFPDGRPVRAQLTVTFNEYTNADLEAKEIKRETADFSKFYLVGQGETLSGIAARVYQNSVLWRPIALRNQIADPRTLSVGLRLSIPRLPFRDPETGEVMQ